MSHDDTVKMNWKRVVIRSEEETTHNKTDTHVSSHSIDEDDEDLDVFRSHPRPQEDVVWIRCATRTSVDRVGMQVWGGSLLLAEWVLEESKTMSKFWIASAGILELGCGTGLLSLCCLFAWDRSIAAEREKNLDVYPSPLRVFATDYCPEALSFVLENGARNRELGFLLNETLWDRLVVRYLDWKTGWSEESLCSNRDNSSCIGGFDSSWMSWTQEEMKYAQQCDLILAADVIYDEDSTIAFFELLLDLERKYPVPDRRIILALERRTYFSATEFVITSDNFRQFLTYVSLGENGAQQGTKPFVGHEVRLDSIPHRLLYSRTDDLQLWEIRIHEQYFAH